ncbi:MAG: ribose 5-phosphate isomerase B [Acholeplasmatales bacterium]|nr:ribose 5-phosphate isomerase B [Acholeplasmatales bacterium]
MKISIACDHGGFELKENLKKWLKENNYEVIDYGTNSLDSCDYPDFGRKAAEAVRDNLVDRGIVICTTGIGMSIVANKVKGIRCALVSNTEGASLTRRHNDSNVLALGAKFTDDALAKEITKIWLETEFEGGRHQRRVDKIMDIEK